MAYLTPPPKKQNKKRVEGLGFRVNEWPGALLVQCRECGRLSTARLERSPLLPAPPLPRCVPIEPMAGAARASYDRVSAKWSRPTTWPARKRLPERGPDAPHVVLSTKFGEPWYTISVGIKEVLEELGCTVYNPNSDNKARSGCPWQKGKAQRV